MLWKILVVQFILANRSWFLHASVNENDTIIIVVVKRIYTDYIFGGN